ncbi:MAG: WecB/TagA/CpsF family glycosyltransferase [Candidatus Kerfeldbacteria bacterium]|nr:WecB/TagA/CpsF family glycosyltransferase [Candidatus Kerfeldbacteria bacterium]
MQRKAISIMGVTVDNLTTEEALQAASRLITEPRFHHVVTPGPEFLLEATAHPTFRRILNDADLSLADGMGLHVGARLQGDQLQQRIPGVDFVNDLMRSAGEQGWSVFLFGGGPGVAEWAAQTLVATNPGLKVVGVESGFRGPWQKVHDRRVLERIHQAKPTILLVALGAPKQELWIDRHRPGLHDVRLAMGVGRTFDYLAGTVRRPPQFIRRVGFEWLYTYLTAGQHYQPQFRRQRVRNATWRFMIELMKHRYAKRTR